MNFKDSEKCLFIVVIRESYDWLRSFYLLPYCVHSTLYNGDFRHFISTEWKLTDKYLGIEGQYDEIDNYNPWTSRPFKNVLELRKYKILNYQSLGRLVDNYLFIRYEDVRNNPKEFIDFVASYCSLEKVEEFVPIKGYKGSVNTYAKKCYFSILQEELDWKVENSIGFYKKEYVP